MAATDMDLVKAFIVVIINGDEITEAKVDPVKGSCEGGGPSGWVGGGVH